MPTDLNLKCANPKCEATSRCSGTGEFFRLEILNPRDASAPASQLSAPSRPRLRVEDYWLCSHCAGIYTLAYDDESRTVFGVKRPVGEPSPEPEFEESVNFLPVI